MSFQMYFDLTKLSEKNFIQNCLIKQCKEIHNIFQRWLPLLLFCGRAGTAAATGASFQAKLFTSQTLLQAELFTSQAVGTEVSCYLTSFTP